MPVYRNCAAAGVLFLALGVGSVSAFNYVTDANGTWWGIQDAASPGVDTGSIRATQIAAGQSARSARRSTATAASRSLWTRRPPRASTASSMRGFGLTFDGVDRF